MTKELSIESIKKELMDAFLGDVRIINSFNNKDVKKTTDYIGKNIFSYLDEYTDYYTIDTYIDFDVSKSKNCYDVLINLKAHKDILCYRNEVVNSLDVISGAIEELVKELYPYNKFYSNMPVRSGDRFARRDIRFVLRVKDYEDYISKMKKEEEPTKDIQEFINECLECINKYKNCSGDADVKKFVAELKEFPEFEQIIKNIAIGRLQK